MNYTYLECSNDCALLGKLFIHYRTLVVSLLYNTTHSRSLRLEICISLGDEGLHETFATSHYSQCDIEIGHDASNIVKGVLVVAVAVVACPITLLDVSVPHRPSYVAHVWFA